MFTPNYLQEADPSTSTTNSVHWWNHFPIKVYFPAGATIQGQNMITVAMNGFAGWNSFAGTNLVTQVFTSGEADVVVTFENSANMPGGWIGQANWNYFPFNMQAVSATIKLKTWDSMTLGQARDGFRRTAQHEMGHVLFLGGHSASSLDNMYPSGTVDIFEALTQRDGNSLLTAYCNSFGNRGGRASLGTPVRGSVSCPPGHSH